MTVVPPPPTNQPHRPPSPLAAFFFFFSSSRARRPLARSLARCRKPRAPNRPPLEIPWVILHREVCGTPGVVVAAAAVGLEGAQDQHAAYEPHFLTSRILIPPGLTILGAGCGAHPNAYAPDRSPYIIATSRFCLLVHFYAAYVGDNPQHSRLVLARNFNFHEASGRFTAAAELVPLRNSHDPRLRNIQGVGLLSWCSNDDVELQVGRVGDHFGTYIVRCRDGQWSRAMTMASPLPLPPEHREWVPHGAVSFHTTIFWFDLSWGVISCDGLGLPGTVPILLYHPLPPGHMLQQAEPDIHNWRCITVSDRRLRYVGMAPAAGEAVPTVTMWTLIIRRDGGRWDRDYTMSFERIWDDDSYVSTRLPREVPVLAAVSPSEPQFVCFALRQIIFTVNVPMHMVVLDYKLPAIHPQGHNCQPPAAASSLGPCQDRLPKERMQDRAPFDFHGWRFVAMENLARAAEKNGYKLLCVLMDRMD